MRIGMFHATLPSAGVKPGGVEKHVVRLASALASAGHEVVLFTYSSGAREDGFHVEHLLPERVGLNASTRMFVAPLQLHTIRTHGLDVLHLHGDDWFYVRRRIPTVRTFYGSALQEARTATRLRRKARMYATYPLEIIASRLATHSYGLIPGADSVYGAVGTLPLGFARRARGHTTRRAANPTLLFVGTWHGRKRGAMLADVFRTQVRPYVPAARLLMVSDRGESGGGVEWLGSPSDGVLMGLYHEAWAFCLPSTYEGFGIPYLEAMSHGLPVIASPNLGADYILAHGQAGVVASDESLGRTITEVLSNAELRTGLSSRALLRAAELASRDLVGEHIDAYDRAIAAYRAQHSSAQ